MSDSEQGTAITFIVDRTAEDLGELASVADGVHAAMGAASPGLERVQWFVLTIAAKSGWSKAQLTARIDQLALVLEVALSFGDAGVYKAMAVRWYGAADVLTPGKVLRTTEGRMQILRVAAVGD